jgi:imidazole glycerol phosphate synthase subunit HisF
MRRIMHGFQGVRPQVSDVRGLFGKMEHFRDVFLKTGCSAALAASIFHYGEI